MPATTPILKLPYPVPADAPDGPAQIQALAEAVEGVGANPSGLLLIGEVRFVALIATPAGWLPCDGAAVSRTTYAKLFTAIGAAYGAGDGTATFNVPDLRGRAPVGAGTGPGLTARAVGTKWGVEAVILTVPQMPSHNHTYSDPGHKHNIYASTVQSPPDGSTLALGFAGNRSNYGPGVQDLAATGISILNAGGGASHDNTQPSLAIPAYIYAGA